MFEQDTYRYNSSRKKLITTGVVVGTLALVLGVVIGYFGRPIPAAIPCLTLEKEPCLGPNVPEAIISEADPEIFDKLMKEVNADNIRENLRKLTLRPHLAGTPADIRTAEEIESLWTSQGLSPVYKTPYDVLLSYPNKTDPNLIYLLDGNGESLFISQREEKILRPEQNQSDVVPPFNAYSAAGDVEGPLVYVNYGRIEDFIFLRDNLSISLNNTIVIARYGKIFRGQKVNHAEQFGAKGVLMYTDPRDYVIDGANSVYPDSWWMPPTGVQRGTLLISNGDPRTPGYPSIDSAYRWPTEQVSLPRIVAHPISYGDAKKFLEKVRMHITTSNQNVTTYNVFGFIKGKIEPDRYVLFGNHRDAWVFGGVDPTSGTAGMLELSRVFGKLYREGWRPRRTIVFCSWGSEEYGLVGSTEWVEEYVKNLEQRAVAYINIDSIAGGNFTLRARSVPMFYDVIYAAAKKIPNPNSKEASAGRLTMYDTWAAAYPMRDRNGSNINIPKIGSLGAGSDFAMLLQHAGVPGISLSYKHPPTWKISGYPLYHSVYETFHLVDNFIDRGFKVHRAVTQLSGEICRVLSDSLILPLNVRAYARALQEYTEGLDMGYGDLMNKNNITLDLLFDAVNQFVLSTQDFEKRLKDVNRKNPLEVRQVNDQMVMLERAFIDPKGIPNRLQFKHLIFAPSVHNSYVGSSFPGLVDLMFEIEKNNDQRSRWEQVKKHLSVLTFVIQSAASTLAPVTEFMENVSR